MKLQPTTRICMIIEAVACCIALVSIPLTSHADTFSIIESKPISELWLNPGMLSYHFKNDNQRNNGNYGFGGEYRYSTVNSVTLGVFNNSFGETSHYAGWYWQPIGVGAIRIGTSVGVMNGYSRHRDGGAFFTLIPTASIESKNIGVNLMYIPPNVKTTGAVSIQFKFKVF